MSKTEDRNSAAPHCSLRRRRVKWRVEFETGFVAFSTTLNITEERAIRWAQRAEECPSGEIVTKVISIPE